MKKKSINDYIKSLSKKEKNTFSKVFLKKVRNVEHKVREKINEIYANEDKKTVSSTHENHILRNRLNIQDNKNKKNN